MASLKESAPAPQADIEETIRRVVELERVLVSRYRVALRVDCARPGLVAAIHPSALRQILIMAIGQLARYASHGEITVCAAQQNDHITLTLTSSSSETGVPPTGNIIQEILASQGGSLEVSSDAEHVSFQITVSSAGQVKVVVVDDNLDQVHFYRRCTAGTRYHIVHAPQGQRTPADIRKIAPDIIVLDILLPDIDGWELLEDLQSCPATAHIPVVICSIIAEKDLAELLGATLYLPKPVHHTAFIQALGQALDPGAATA
jgi:CheY-like chemotaxis protein